MIDEYSSGRTPNPDVMCNKEVKFGAFLNWAKNHGADYIATGHYSQIKDGNLIKSVDENKDQTYFLWTLNKDQLSYVLFPVGHLQKSGVRSLAEKYNLPTKNKKDSQGLCFVGTIDVKTLLKNYIEEKRGDVKNEKGDIIGYHDGVTFYTIGERHGFTITKKTVDDEPYFVTGKEISTNTLVVSHNIPQESKGDSIKLEKTNWLKKMKKGEIYEARARYRAPLSKAEIINDKEVKLLSGNLTLASGQSLVLYDGDLCIGGGIII